MTAGPSLDPDVLAGLEREREFLLRSLDDLDAEHAAGDMDDTDHAGLADDYTRRLAEVSRAIDDERVAFAQVESRLNSKQRILTVAGVVLLALIAGVLLSRASGFRSPEDSTTGDIRRSSAGLLAEADTLTREGQWPEAIDVYNEVLDLSPANVEALTYRGWLTARLGEAEEGLVDLNEAVELDPAFPDARVFSAILLDDDQQFDAAAEQLGVLDTLDVPNEILGLVASSNLRASVAAGQIATRFSDRASVVDLSEINAPLNDVALAGNLLTPLDPVLGIKVFSAVLEQDPDQLIALVGRGRILGTDPSFPPEQIAEGLALLDQAIALDPASNEIRLFRAQARIVSADLDGARADLALVDTEALAPDFAQLHAELTADVS